MNGDQNQDIQNYPSRPWPPAKQETETLVVDKPPLLFDRHKYEHEILDYKISEIEKRLSESEERRTQVVAIQNLDSKRLELKMPLVVTIESTEQDTFIVWSEDLNTYGEGKSEEEAKDDFFKNVEELYFDLKQDKDNLGPAMEKIWKFLQKIIKEL